jgi:hypothetical protein
MRTRKNQMLAINTQVKLSPSYLREKRLEGTTYAKKVGTVLSTEQRGATQFVWVGWAMTGEGFLVTEGRPSPLVEV